MHAWSKNLSKYRDQQKQTNFVTFFPRCLHSTFIFFLRIFPTFFSFCIRLFFLSAHLRKPLSAIIYSLPNLYIKVRTSFLLSHSNRTTTPGTLLKHKPIQTTWYAATPPRLVYIQLWLNNSDFGKDIVTPWWWS